MLATCVFLVQGYRGYTILSFGVISLGTSKFAACVKRRLALFDAQPAPLGEEIVGTSLIDQWGQAWLRPLNWSSTYEHPKFLANFLSYY